MTRPLRPIDGVTAAVDQLQCEVRALNEQVNMLLCSCACLALVVTCLLCRKGARA